MNRLLFGLIVSTFALNSFSQDIKRNIVFVEGFGSTGHYSVNYERLLFKSDNINLGARIGFSYVPNLYIYNSKYIFPLSLSLLKNVNKNHYLEIRISASNAFYQYEDWSSKGLGDSTGTFVPENKLGMDFLPGIGVGYRYQPQNNGLYFNFLYQSISYFNKEEWYRNLSIGVGYVF